MSTSYVFFVIFIGITLLLSVLVGISWLIARNLCKPKRHIPVKTPEDYNLPFQNISFKSGKSIIKGWFIPACYSLPNNNIVILNHGWSSNSSRLLYLAKQHHNDGFSVLVYDSRGHGRSESDGPITLLKFVEDVQSAINFLLKNKVTSKSKIGVFGHSMGASAAILAASMDSRISAVVSCSAFDDPKKISANFLRLIKIPSFLIKMNFIFINKWLGRSISSIAPINRIYKIGVPILLVHGLNDRIVSPYNTNRLYKAASRINSTKWILKDRDHRNIIQNEEFAKGVIKFFSKNLIVENELSIYSNKTKLISTLEDLKYGT